MSDQAGQNGDNVPDSVRGLGMVVDSRTAGQDLRLIRTAVKNWKIRDEAYTVLPDSLLGISLDKNRDDRARVAAARVLATMNGQNNDNAHAEMKAGQPAGGLVVNVGVAVTAKIAEDSDWYGNSNRLAALSAAAHAEGVDVAGAVQGGGVRSPVGESTGNGHANPNGHGVEGNGRH